MDALKEFLTSEDIAFEENVSAAGLCSFRTGGSVSYLIKPASEKSLISLVTFLAKEGIKYTVLGKGSNVVFPDGAYDGAIVATGNINNISAEDNIITAQTGATLFSLSTFAAGSGLSGLEFANGIPGSVGGAIYMNAGAYGSEISDIMISCRYLDLSHHKIVEADVKSCDFSYRHSIFKGKRSLLVLSGKFGLEYGDPKLIKEKITDLRRRRLEKQPLEYPSAGSTFKRPCGSFAGKLIEECGLKGFGFGGACVSEKHAGFIINRSNASSEDIKKTVEYVRDKVFEQTGVRLECEIEFLE